MSIEPLVDLAAVINQEHALTYYSVIDALEHAILCGEALIKARADVPEGQWTRWVKNNLEMESGAVSRYVRIATYREHLLAADDRPQTINAAITYLRGIEVPRIETPTGSKPGFDVSEARRLRDSGMTYDRIAEMLGVSDVAIQRQLVPGRQRAAIERRTREVNKKRAEEREAAQHEVDEKVGSIGGDLAQAYLWLRDVEAVFERMIADTDNETGQTLHTALVSVHRAEDVITRILGVPRKRRVLGRKQ